MNIRLTYEQDFAAFQHLFPELKMYDPLDKEPIDLLIFPGGEDVRLDWYLDRESAEEFQNLCATNPIRDEVEAQILLNAIDGDVEVKRILGVCRGTQFLNVMFGGTLFPDLPSYNIRHGRYHNLNHKLPSSLNFFKEVNSLHHQGIRLIGNRLRRGSQIRTYPIRIATDIEGNVTEIVTWLDDKVLGIQFHPEYYSDSHPDKEKFKKLIYDWVNDKAEITTKKTRELVW